ncbi:MAG TPA: hypothetical protein VMT64_05725, partial [Candidatus Binataceae bacterium]|nr:hypothetical protein [Candidatus Binataceae bacterium]
SARWRDLATMLACLVMLSAVALYNRYPLVYADTGSYLKPENFPPRSFFYNAFIAPARLTGTLWTVVPVQAVLTVFMLRLVLREVFGIASRLEFLAIVAVLCLFTSLPWIVGFVMPDIFTPMLVLGIFLLVFRFERLGRWERYGVIALTFVSIVVQYSHPPLAIALIIACIAIRLVREGRESISLSHQAVAALLSIGGVAAIIILNYRMIGMATFSPGGYAFELSRLVEDGSAVAFLRDHCPTRNYAACAYLPRMPMTSTDFLWAPDSIFHRVGFIEERNEGMEIVAGTIREHPLWVAKDAIADTASQLYLVETGVGLDAAATNVTTLEPIQLYYPDDVRAFVTSRQGRGDLLHPEALQKLDLAFAFASICACCFVAALFARDREWPPLELMLTVACAIVLNAFVTGAISQPHPRYGARLIWLVTLIALASWRKSWSVTDARRVI